MRGEAGMTENDLQTLNSKIQHLESMIDEVLVALGKRRPPVVQEYLRIADAAASIGTSAKALQNQLALDAASPTGIHPRRLHGAIHAGDFQRFVDSRKRKPGRGAVVRQLLEKRGL
jgi:hypothetical protein